MHAYDAQQGWSAAAGRGWALASVHLAVLATVASGELRATSVYLLSDIPLVDVASDRSGSAIPCGGLPGSAHPPPGVSCPG